MADLSFKAPALFEPTAKPSDDLLGALHDAIGMAEHLAKIEKFARWLKSKMNDKGIAAKGPFVDESGWIIEAPSNGGFVTCILSGPERDDTNFHLLVSEFAGATGDVGQAVHAILAGSPEISELLVKQ